MVEIVQVLDQVSPITCIIDRIEFCSNKEQVGSDV